MRVPPFVRRESADGIVHLRLNDALRDALAGELGYPGYVAADENAQIARLKLLVATLIGPWGVETLADLSVGRGHQGVVLFENMPHEPVDWSPLPGAPAHSAKATSLSEHLLLAFSAFFGDAYGVSSEGHRLINDLIPSIADIDRHTGNGSRRSLGLHTENAALRFASPGRDYSPKALLLTGVSVQPLGGPVTPVAIASQAVALLDAWAEAELRGPCTMIALPERHREPGRAEEVGPVQVILGARGAEEVVAAFYGDMMRPVSTRAEQALAQLRARLEDVAVELAILPGMLAYIVNGRALHGRSDFEPSFDADGRARRWIQRVFVTGRLDGFLGSRALTDRVFDLALPGQ
jgi:hypothetical protein